MTFIATFHLGLPDKWHDGTDKSSLMILDDLMHEAGKRGDVGAIFSRTSHHRNVSLIILVQNFFHKKRREITSNCHYITLMKNPRDSAFVACLGRQINGVLRILPKVSYSTVSETISSVVKRFIFTFVIPFLPIIFPAKGFRSRTITFNFH